MAMKSKIGINLIKIASIYMVLGLILGVIMGMSKNHTLTTVHAHMSLLGWSTMGITGLIYISLPDCGNNALAKTHFWLHNIGLPIIVVSLTLFYGYGNAQAEPVAGIGSIIVLLGLIAFAANILINVKGN